MPVDDHEHGLTAPRQRGRRWLLFSLAAALVLIAWLLARYLPVSRPSASGEPSFSYNLIAVGALPWFLQWAGVICAILGFSHSAETWEAAVFAILVSFTLAAIWWFGVAWRFWGMGPLDELMELTSFALESLFGTATIFDEILFNFIGPILGPLQLRGPVNLQGWNFPATVLSTGVLVGYLMVVGSICRVGNRARSVLDYVKFIAAMLPCFLPPIIRLGIQIARKY